LFWEPLPGADVERDAFPPPVIDPELQRDIRLSPRIGRHARLLAVARHGHAFDETSRVLASDAVRREVLARDAAQRAEHLHLLVPNGLVVERGRRLHGNEGEELKEVVLDDVAHRARVLVIPGALAHADGLGHRDLDMVDVLPIPDRLEDAVRETHDEDVLNGLLAKVVVDAEYLVLPKDRVHDLVELERRLAVVAERFLDDDARPSGLASEAVFADRFDDRLVRGRRRREIEEPVRVCAEGEIELVERAPELFVSGVVRRRDEVKMLSEAAPDLLVERSRPAVLRDRAMQLLAVLLVAQRLAGGTDDGERGGEQTLEREVVKGRNELPLREVARAAEDDDRGGLGDA